MIYAPDDPSRVMAATGAPSTLNLGLAVVPLVLAVAAGLGVAIRRQARRMQRIDEQPGRRGPVRDLDGEAWPQRSENPGVPPDQDPSTAVPLACASTAGGFPPPVGVIEGEVRGGPNRGGGRPPLRRRDDPMAKGRPIGTRSDRRHTCSGSWRSVASACSPRAPGHRATHRLDLRCSCGPRWRPC